MKILVLGSTGMLGSAVGRHFLETDHKTILTYRDKDVAYGDSQRFFDASDTNLTLLDPVGSAPYDYVINCIGTIKPFMAGNPRDARYINSVFPWDLAKRCNKNGSKLIHITTDCVFSGDLSPHKSYTESDTHDARDDYGKSKSLGEPVGECMVIRTSIIGEEIHKNASLIEWAKSQKDKEVRGFVNHLWNGITTDTYAKVCQTIIENDLWKPELFHVFSKDVVNKLQMMEYFNEAFDLGLKIAPFETPVGCNRSLGTEKDLCEKLSVPTVREQVMDL